MNGPKLLAQIAVVAIAFILLYPAISEAVPENINGMPVSVSFDGGVSVEVKDDMNIEFTMPSLTVKSDLPQKIDNFDGKIYLGGKDCRILIGTYSSESIAAEASTSIDFKNEGSVCLAYFLSYIPMMSDNGKVDFPLYLSIGFEYMKWNGVNLVDFDMVLKASAGSDGTVYGPDVIGTDSTAAIDTTGGIPGSIISCITSTFGNSFTITSGSATMDATIAGSTLEVTAGGDGTRNAYEILKSDFTSNGVLSFTLGTHTATVSGDAAAAIVKAVKSYYPEA